VVGLPRCDRPVDLYLRPYITRVTRRVMYGSGNVTRG
jgi:hypothetical protein